MPQVLENAIPIEVILRNIRGSCADWLEALDKEGVDYRVKMNLALTGLWASPCLAHERNNYEGCKWPRTKDEDYKTEVHGWCCTRCGYPMDAKFMSPTQLAIYAGRRALENKKIDFLKHPENEPIYLAVLSKEERAEIIKSL
jgi:hypothetical protein